MDRDELRYRPSASAQIFGITEVRSKIDLSDPNGAQNAARSSSIPEGRANGPGGFAPVSNFGGYPDSKLAKTGQP